MADRFSGRRMAKNWDAMPSLRLLLTGNGTTQGTALSFLAPATVIRMIGEYTITPSSVTTATDGVSITIGIGVFSTDAFAAGSGSMPDPGGEAEFPWLYWADHQFEFAAAVTDPASAAGSVRRAFDIRSMRKLKPGQSLGSVVQYGNIAGNPPMSISLGQVRCLLAT